MPHYEWLYTFKLAIFFCSRRNPVIFLYHQKFYLCNRIFLLGTDKFPLPSTADFRDVSTSVEPCLRVFRKRCAFLSIHKHNRNAARTVKSRQNGVNIPIITDCDVSYTIYICVPTGITTRTTYTV